ncbi:hypothetical protein Clacol_006283 [Clathrus columnatus]|uniref:Importin N-terminal domain-containing protein n=1 Tax=Clathrus columnatus TaxID=1419009 RepID=A0AAV5AEH4_9AGAM|nr:hypothetical protein Clacol_006283 [Clathrus columnatus]
MDSEIGRCLADTLNPDLNHSSGSVLRKYVREHWSPYFGSFKGSAPPTEIKDAVRNAIFQCLSDPQSKIRSMAANVLSLIANCDWPDNYPSLLNDLLTLLSSVSPHSVHGAMQVFTEFAKDDLTEDQLLPVLQHLLPVLLNILGDHQHHSPITRARSVSVFRQCLQALYMVKEQHPQAIKDAIVGILPEWIEAFKVLLMQDLNFELSESDRWDALLVRVQIFKTLDVINIAFDRSLKFHATSFLDISLHHLQVLLPSFAKYNIYSTDIAPTSSEDEIITIPRLATPIIDYISSLSRRSAAKIWFDSTNLIPLTCAIFQWIQMTGEDEELWTNNPNAFLAQEDDESQEYSVRVAGLDLLSNLLERFPTDATRALEAATTKLIDSSNIARQYGTSDWWRALEAVLAALGGVSSSVLEVLEDEESSTRMKSIDIEGLLLNVVPPVLALSGNGRGFVFASQYAKRLTPGLASQYLEAALQALESTVAGIPVKVSAVKAIRNEEIASFCSQVEESVVVNVAPQIIRGLGPFLATTTEDTLALVLETTSVVVEIGEGEWLDPDLALLLSQVALDIWTRNIKDPILLSVLEDLFTDLASSRTPGVYQAVVTQCLPILCNALAQPNLDQPFITTSAIDLISALAQGAQRGALGDGFFAALAPHLFARLRDRQDNELLENAIVLLTLVIRKDASQILSWTDDQGQSGLVNILSLVGRVLAPSENDTGGLVVGDLIIHLLRNAGDSVLPVLPDLIKAVVNRMTTAKTLTLSQSLITPLTYLIYSHRDSVLGVLSSFTVTDTKPVKTGLEVFLSAWMENSEGLQGLWSQRISDLAICSILSSNRTDLFNIPVKGDVIITPETANVIMTRSKTKNAPHEYRSITFAVKAFKQLLQDLGMDEDCGLDVKNADAQSDDGVRLSVPFQKVPEFDWNLNYLQDSQWADSDEDGEKLIQGLKKDEYAYLSEILGGKSGFDDDEDGPSGGLDDEDLKEDPVYTMDIKAYLRNFISQFAQQPELRPMIDQLNAQEILIVKRIVEGTH